MSTDYGHWNIESVIAFNPDEWFGFIYLITNITTKQKYLGKKQFKSKKQYHLNKKKKSKYVDSGWAQYTSSSDIVKDDILKYGKENFSFAILKLCSGKAELTYSEESFQYTLNVLYETTENGSKAYYNKTIGHKHFAGVEKQSLESAAKIKSALNLNSKGSL